MARRAARRAAALLVDDTLGNSSSLEISPFTVGAGLVGSSVHVGSLFRGEAAQVRAVAAAQDTMDGARPKEKGIGGACITVSIPSPHSLFSNANSFPL